MLKCHLWGTHRAAVHTAQWFRETRRAGCLQVMVIYLQVSHLLLALGKTQPELLT